MKVCEEKLKVALARYATGYRKGWRSALEEIIQRGMHQYGNDFLSMDLYKDIEKELEEE